MGYIHFDGGDICKLFFDRMASLQGVPTLEYFENEGHVKPKYEYQARVKAPHRSWDEFKCLNLLQSKMYFALFESLTLTVQKDVFSFSY